MRFTKGVWALVVINFLAVAAFAVYYLSIQNYEFLWYIGVMVFFFVLILATLKRTAFDLPILGGLTLWGLLHLAGGGLIVKGKALYALPLIHLLGSGDSFILKYDQLVHFIGFGVATLVFYHLLKSYLGEHVNYKVLNVLVILGGMGVGALNEIVEFIAVLSFPATGVGGYYNTMIDIVFNTFGAIVAIAVIHMQRLRKSKNSIAGFCAII